MSQTINLGSLFQAVTRDLMKSQQSLNQADSYNQDHGDNMVQTFKTITKAVQQKQKRGGSDSEAMAFAARKLSKSSSASAQLYSQSLAKAAEQFQGKKVDVRSGLQLLQTLIGGGQTASQNSSSAAGGDLLDALLGGMGGGQGSQSSDSAAGGDLLGTLLGGMGGSQQSQSSDSATGGDLLGALLGGATGDTQPQAESSGSAGGGDLLGTLLGGLTGSGSSSSGSGLQDGLDLGDLLTVGMAYMQYKKQGASNLEALVKAFMKMSGMGRSQDRTQSTELVVGSFLKALGMAQ